MVLVTEIERILFFLCGPPKEDIFLTTFYGLNFNQQVHILYRLQFLFASEGSFHVLRNTPLRPSCIDGPTKIVPFYLERVYAVTTYTAHPHITRSFLFRTRVYAIVSKLVTIHRSRVLASFDIVNVFHRVL